MANSNEYMREYMKQRYYKRRLKAIEYLGGKCAACENTEELEIDHIDATQKTFSLGKGLAGWNWERLQAELDKCQLLCKDCHAKKTRKDLAIKLNQREHWEHGTLGGYRYCKCQECKNAKSAYYREYRKRKASLV